jgi:ABC-type microcin C transport system permease subunit YejB
MRNYVLQRILATVPVMGVVVLFVFLLLRVAPGDPAALIAGDYATPEDIAKIRVALGLDKPMHVQLGIWLAALARADLGTSIYSKLPVTHLMAQRLERIFPSKKLHNPQYYPVFQLVTGIEYGLNVATKNATACIDLNGVCGYHKHLKTKGGSM